jgi:heptosyltransferase-2
MNLLMIWMWFMVLISLAMGLVFGVYTFFASGELPHSGRRILLNGYPRFLVLRGGAIGDFVLSLPVFQLLRRQWPTAYIEVLGYPHIARLALLPGLVDHVTSLDGAHVARLFAAHSQIPPDQQAHIQAFQVVISFLYDPDDTVRQNLLAAGARQVIYGCPKVQRMHAVDHFASALAEMAVFPEGEEKPELCLPEESRQRGRSRVRPDPARTVAIHAGSGSPLKNWPLERFLALADRLLNTPGWHPLFIVGEADSRIREHLALRRPDLPVLTGLTLQETAESLSVCRAYVGNDSGITHLAAALGVPTVAIYGPTDPRLWGVRGAHTRRVTGDSQTSDALSGIPVEQVWEELRGLLGE